MIDYVKLRAQTHEIDKCGLSWMMIKYKCLKWERYGNINNFQCSYGWMNKRLQLHGMAQMNLHGEAEDINDEEV